MRPRTHTSQDIRRGFKAYPIHASLTKISTSTISPRLAPWMRKQRVLEQRSLRNESQKRVASSLEWDSRHMQGTFIIWGRRSNKKGKGRESGRMAREGLVGLGSRKKRTKGLAPLLPHGVADLKQALEKKR